MSPREDILHKVVEDLSSPASYESVMHRSNHEMPMPSVEVLTEVVENLRAVLFPGYFGTSELRPETMKYYVGSTLDQVVRLLTEQIMRGLCFACIPTKYKNCAECQNIAHKMTLDFISRLPLVRHMLSTDVKAAYIGDPAAKSPGEAIFCYPSIQALFNQRIAHELYKIDIPLIPRIITEMAHSVTGIDIHPGAEIGKYFFMDHGTGIVIGETTIIGNNVRIYQGVTLGAKSFPLDEQGNPIKGIPRHPIVEDDVIVYSGATILGRVTIGKGSVIGGNVWVTRNIPPGSRVLQTDFQELYYENGAGI
ncbi:MAG: serine acetyltransferase [Candidatus Fischerbacteria bacterium RBG_13_37_8]|uniref:serine O-acetyltransferase n=1 Tax=Candidatus Fischerbacteria bacterium RBG_13_37_8 TaxID=1817863 RepID=A0A1F5V4G3_9BACT|nr:MAG: serine acetyltransferase [Candidatus Fischerbacteria bacterium RBG_13_37_8]